MLELCINRETEWPRRGPEYDKFKSYMEELESQVLEASLSNYSDMIFEKTISDKTIFVFGSMKSGTSLVLNLLDGHSKLASLPVDAHLLKHQNLGNDKKKAFRKIHNVWFKKLISPTGRAPFLIFGLNIEKYINFSKRLRILIEKEGLESFQAFHSASKAYIEECDLFPVGDELTVVEKTPENEFQYKKIKENFHNHKVVHIIRDPIINLASLKKNAINLNYSFNLPISLDSIFKSMHCSISNAANNDNYKVIRYEDLTSDLNNTMESVSKFLEIKFEKSLTSPTAHGKAMKSNSMSSEYYDHKKVYSRNQKEEREKSLLFFDKNEIDYINQLFKNKNVLSLMSHYGYDV